MSAIVRSVKETQIPCYFPCSEGIRGQRPQFRMERGYSDVPCGDDPASSTAAPGFRAPRRTLDPGTGCRGDGGRQASKAEKKFPAKLPAGRESGNKLEGPQPAWRAGGAVRGLPLPPRGEVVDCHVPLIATLSPGRRAGGTPAVPGKRRGGTARTPGNGGRDARGLVTGRRSSRTGRCRRWRRGRPGC